MAMSFVSQWALAHMAAMAICREPSIAGPSIAGSTWCAATSAAPMAMHMAPVGVDGSAASELSSHGVEAATSCAARGLSCGAGLPCCHAPASAAAGLAAELTSVEQPTACRIVARSEH